MFFVLDKASNSKAPNSLTRAHEPGLYIQLLLNPQLAQSSGKCLQNSELYASKQPWLPIFVEERVAPVALEGLRTHPRWKCVQRRCDEEYDDDDDDT